MRDRQDILGYGELSDEQIELINLVKQNGESLRFLLEALSKKSEVDQRWVGIGANELQLGLMALSRAIGQPTTF
ncbi:MAG: hypothetical protein EOM24_27105 [Chloroflexia bacterium]|nr:hypothetical protein [Chloroflexia bacterium]